MAVNGTAPGILAKVVRRLDAVLVHYLTDYIFDGTKATAYTETDMPNPLSIYGKTELLDEQAIQAANPAHYILRTSWVHVAEGINFLNTILQLIPASTAEYPLPARLPDNSRLGNTKFTDAFGIKPETCKKC